MKLLNNFIFIFLFIFLIGFVLAGNLRVTEEHPFYVDNGWKEAKNLEQGDIFLLEDGRKARVVSVEKKFLNYLVDVFNLHVFGFNNYFAENVLVHNKAASAGKINPEEVYKYFHSDLVVGSYRKDGNKIDVVFVPGKSELDAKAELEIIKNYYSQFEIDAETLKSKIDETDLNILISRGYLSFDDIAMPAYMETSLNNFKTKTRYYLISFDNGGNPIFLAGYVLDTKNARLLGGEDFAELGFLSNSIGVRLSRGAFPEIIRYGAFLYDAGLIGRKMIGEVRVKHFDVYAGRSNFVEDASIEIYRRAAKESGQTLAFVFGKKSRSPDYIVIDDPLNSNIEFSKDGVRFQNSEMGLFGGQPVLISGVKGEVKNLLKDGNPVESVDVNPLIDLEPGRLIDFEGKNLENHAVTTKYLIVDFENFKKNFCGIGEISRTKKIPADGEIGLNDVDVYTGFDGGSNLNKLTDNFEDSPMVMAKVVVNTDSGKTWIIKGTEAEHKDVVTAMYAEENGLNIEDVKWEDIENNPEIYKYYGFTFMISKSGAEGLRSSYLESERTRRDGLAGDGDFVYYTERDSFDFAIEKAQEKLNQINTQLGVENSPEINQNLDGMPIENWID